MTGRPAGRGAPDRSGQSRAPTFIAFYISARATSVRGSRHGRDPQDGRRPRLGGRGGCQAGEVALKVLTFAHPLLASNLQAIDQLDEASINAGWARETRH